jgi:SAM-dependent methyltransferase
MSQNIFDNESFFEQYKNIRNKSESFNNLIEQPSMESLLPDMRGKTILDMGCGFGNNCKKFISKGAAKVVGIDISEKMINVAKTQNMDKNIHYELLCMKEVSKLNLKFDFAYSSLAIHYIDDFELLIKNVYNILYDDGILLFSQEHPLSTAPFRGPSWIKDEHEVKESALISNYMEEGMRSLVWLGEVPREYYHRSFSTIVNVLVDSSFSIIKIIEPVPTAKALEVAPWMSDEVHRPSAIIIKAKKNKTHIITA